MATATGIHHRTYQAELALRHTKAEFARLVIMAAALVAAPSVLNSYWLGIVNTILIAVIGAVGLNILVGFTGQISLGQGGFLAVGAFTSALLSTRAGLPVPLSLLAAVLGLGNEGGVVHLRGGEVVVDLDGRHGAVGPQRAFSARRRQEHVVRRERRGARSRARGGGLRGIALEQP